MATFGSSLSISQAFLSNGTSHNNNYAVAALQLRDSNASPPATHERHCTDTLTASNPVWAYAAAVCILVAHGDPTMAAKTPCRSLTPEKQNMRYRRDPTGDSTTIPTQLQFREPCVMATLPPTDNYAMSPAAQVLTDPVLWRCITRFQHGLPLSLYEFWVTHEPAVAVSNDRVLTYAGLDRLMKLVVTHGTPQQLDQVANVLFTTSQPHSSGAQWVTRGLDGVVHQAVKANRADMLQYAITNNAPCDKLRDLWYTAIRACHDGDIRVLDVLQAYKPTTAKLFQGWTREIKHVRVAQWADTHYPGVLGKDDMGRVVHEGNLAMVQYLVEHHPNTDFGTWSFQCAHQRRHFDILRYLLEKLPAQVDPRFLKRLLWDGDKAMLTMLREVGGFEAHVHREASEWILNDNLDQLKRLFEEGLLTKASEFSIDSAASSGKLDIIKCLVERATTTATTEAMDGAACHGKWDVVEYLHAHRKEGCTTAAMDAAAEKGFLHYVKFFHEKRTEGCTTEAMNAAAKGGALDIVQFLHEHRTEGCTTETMDHAAGNGHLHIVKLLHEHRTEGCTTEAMDLAAGRGHTRVVEYLQANRSEGCTVAAIKDAAKNGYLDIVRFLYKHYPALFGPDVLYDLLLRGAFDIWMELRDQYPDQAAEAVESVLVEAGKKMEYATIQFVVQELGRTDLAHLAMDGAAKSYFHREAQWPRAVYTITGPGSCHLSAIENAMESIKSYSQPDKLQFLISVCSGNGARELAISLLNGDPDKRPVASKLQDRQLQFPALTPLLLDVRSPSWAIFLALGDFGLVQDPYFRVERPIPWAIQAINRGGDHRLLHVVNDLRASGKLTAESMTGMFRLDGARAAAVRNGDLVALKWLFENVPELPVEPTLLDEALYYHQFEIATYLALHYSESCREIDWGDKPYVPWLGPCSLDIDLLDWILNCNNAVIQKAADLSDIASFAALTDDLAVLKHLHATHPEIVMQHPDLMTRAREQEEPSDEVIAFLHGIQYPFQ